MDMRRLRSVASDIAKGWSEHVPEIEKRAMMWAIQEFHRWMVSENDKLSDGGRKTHE